MDAPPLLSVTVLNYNYGHYLPQCLDSILAQTLRDFEVILVNDCSTDDSLDVIAPYLAADARIRLVDHKVNQGYVKSLLDGCEQSRGKYLTVISADDYALTPDAFARSLDSMEAHPDVSLFFAAWDLVHSDGTPAHTCRAADADYVHDGIGVELRRMALSSPVLHSGAMLRRTAYDAVGGYNSDCRYSVDTNMWLALCTVGKVAYSNTPLFAYRAHGTNLSQSTDSLWQATDEMLRGIDRALERVDPAALPGKDALRRAARARALVSVPTYDIFAGRRARGWRGYFIAFRHYPVETLFQRRFFSLVLQTLRGGPPKSLANSFTRRTVSTTARGRAALKERDERVECEKDSPTHA